MQWDWQSTSPASHLSRQASWEAWEASTEAVVVAAEAMATKPATKAMEKRILMVCGGGV